MSTTLCAGRKDAAHYRLCPALPNHTPGTPAGRPLGHPNPGVPRPTHSPLALPVQAEAGGRRRGGAEQALGSGPGRQPREASGWRWRRRGRLAGLGGRRRRRRGFFAAGTQARRPSVQGDVVEEEEGGLAAPGVPASPRHGRRVPGSRRGPGGAGGRTRGSSRRGRGHARVRRRAVPPRCCPLAAAHPHANVTPPTPPIGLACPHANRVPQTLPIGRDALTCK